MGEPLTRLRLPDFDYQAPLAPSQAHLKTAPKSGRKVGRQTDGKSGNTASRHSQS